MDGRPLSGCCPGAHDWPTRAGRAVLAVWAARRAYAVGGLGLEGHVATGDGLLCTPADTTRRWFFCTVGLGRANIMLLPEDLIETESVRSAKKPVGRYPGHDGPDGLELQTPAVHILLEEEVRV